MQADALEGGFADTPRDAARAFRAVMTAMACPGQIHAVTGVRPPAPLSVAAGVVLLTLCDIDTPLFLAPSHDTQAVRDWITFHSSAPLVAPDRAMFALGRWPDLRGLSFPVGTPTYPDRSATLVVELDRLEPAGTVLSGPGLAAPVELSLPERDAFRANSRLFPLGLDFLFTCDTRLAGLPRSTRIA